LRHRIATFRLSPIFGRVPVIAAAAILMWAMAAVMSSKTGVPLNSGMQISVRDTESFLDEGGDYCRTRPHGRRAAPEARAF
jgi:hypothetical protein